MPLNAKLVVVGGDVKTAEIKLRLPSTIGRGRGATIMLPHPLVSRQHCELFEDGGHLMVRDLGSLNGTFVNNERITESSLPPGELLTVGAVTFRAVYEAEESNGPPSSKSSSMKTTRPADTNPNGAVRTAPKPSETPDVANDDDEIIDFNFDEPVTPVEDAAPAPKLAAPKLAVPKAAAPATPIAKNPPVKAPPTKGPSPPAPSPAPAGTKESAAKPAAAPKKDEATIEFKGWGAEEAETEEGQDDDDLNDFLKSMGGNK